MSKGTIVIYTFLASLALMLFTLDAGRLSGALPSQDFFVFAPAAALLVFELAGILRAYQKRSENLDKLVRWVFKMNLGLMVSADVLMMFWV